MVCKRESKVRCHGFYIYIYGFYNIVHSILTSNLHIKCQISLFACCLFLSAFRQSIKEFGFCFEPI